MPRRSDRPGRRVGIFLDPETLDMIEKWRKAQRPVLTQSQAMRELMWSGYRADEALSQRS